MKNILIITNFKFLTLFWCKFDVKITLGKRGFVKSINTTHPFVVPITASCIPGCVAKHEHFLQKRNKVKNDCVLCEQMTNEGLFYNTF